MSEFTPYRVILYGINTASGRGRGDIAAVIHDVKDVGASEMANAAGEFFFTLPMSHPQISAIQPLQQHYRLDRLNPSTNVYETKFVGLIDDYEATPEEIVFYGS